MSSNNCYIRYLLCSFVILSIFIFIYHDYISYSINNYRFTVENSSSFRNVTEFKNVTEKVKKKKVYKISQNECKQISNSIKNLVTNKSSIPVISFETGFYNFSSLMEKFHNKEVKSCPNNCIYHDSMKPTNYSADVYIYHSRMLLTYKYLEPIIKCRHENSLQVLFASEFPKYAPLHMNSSLFDLVLSHIPQFNISRTHDNFGFIDETTKSTEIWTENEVDEAIKMKTETSLWIVSHCDVPSARNDYVNELLKHINVSIYGKCNDKECDKKCEKHEIKKHYFYLAFENQVCNAYVSEKFWRLKQLIVPIVLSRKIMPKTIPDDVYIAADDFDTPQDLADYLKFLMKNKDEYRKYFSWTKKYEKAGARIDQLCQICDLAYKFRNQSSRKEILKTALTYEKWIKFADCKDNFANNVLLKNVKY